jgi:Tfp pilus assembly protein PilV
VRIVDRIRSRCSAEQDSGFGLLESVISMAIVTIVMTGLGALLITMTQVSGKQRDSQVATQIADSMVDKVRAVGAASAVSGRDKTSAQTQFNGVAPATLDSPAKSAALSPWLSSMTYAYDSTAASGAGSAASLPTLPTHQSVNGTTFSINDFVGWCYKAVAAADCTATQTTGSVQDVRVVVAVTWRASSCPSTGCSYISATLLNGSGDPVFNFNQAAPPSPTMASIPTQNAAVNDNVNGLLGIAGCASPCAPPVSNYVPPLIYQATGLPNGLSMSGSGVVTGTPTTTGTSTVTVNITDAFLDSSSTQFTWTVNPALTFAKPADRFNTAGDAVAYTIGAPSGGTGSGYSFTATGLPSGITINSVTGALAGVLPINSGHGNTPYTPTITLHDGSGYRVFAQTFNWTVYYAPLSVNVVASQVSTVNYSIGSMSLASVAVGGSGQVLWTDPTHSLPAGLSISADGQSVIGTPSTLGTTAVVSLTVTDQITGEVKTATLSWSVVVPPTVTNPSSIPPSSVWGSPTATAPFSCPHAPCTVSATGLPPGLGVVTPTGTSGSATISGQITGVAGTYTPVLKITDAAGASFTQAPFTWQVVSAPTINSPAAQTTSVGATIPTLSQSYACPASPCTFAVSGGALPTGLSLNTSTGAITGTVGGSANSYSTTVSISDADGSSAPATVNWTVKAAPTVTTPSTQTVSVGGSNSFTPSVTCAAAPCAYTATGLPSFLSINSSTGVISGTGSGSPQTFSGLKITITDTYGSTATSGAFSWSLVAAPTVTAPTTPSNSVGAVVGLSLTNTCPATPCNFAVASGTLPPGLTLSSAGVISGTITGVPQTYSNIAVKITDTYGAHANSTTFSWVVVGAPSITTPANQTTSIGGAVSAFTPGSSCPASPCSFAVAAGSLPAGLSLNASTGTISGTVSSSATTQSGLKLKITDTFGSSTTTSAFTWTILAAPTISMSSPTTSVGGTANVAPTATCAGGGCVYALAAGTLPAGLSLNASTGAITGTPTTIGVSTGLKVKLTDAYGSSATSPSFTWTVVAAPTITAPSNRTASVGAPVSFAAPVTTCAGSPCTFSLGAGSLPAGVTVDPTSGALTGTVTGSAGTYPGLKLTITDAYGSSATSSAFTVTINAAPGVTPPANQTTSVGATIPTVNIGGSSCPSPSCSFGIGAGTLPAGLSINSVTGAITGTVTGSNGAYTGIQVSITDNYGATTLSAPFTWTVNPAPAVPNLGTLIVSYGGTTSVTPSYTCPSTPCSYALTSGVLPTGLSLNSSTGTISGTDSAIVGTYGNLKIRITDGYGASTTSAAFSYSVVSPPSLTTPGTQTVSATGAASFMPAFSCYAPPCTFTASGLPAWLSINPTTGTISGTAPPTTGTTSGITITITDAYGAHSTSGSFSWTVVGKPTIAQPSPSPTISIGGDTVLYSPVGDTVCPGAPCTYSLAAGSLPTGLTLNPDGSFSGSVANTAVTVSGLKIRVTDAYGVVTTMASTFTWSVVAAPTISSIANQTNSKNSAVSLTPTFTCPGNGPLFSATGLPTGVTINSTSGKMSGTVTSKGTYSVTVTLTDQYGSAVNRSFTWTVN